MKHFCMDDSNIWSTELIVNLEGIGIIKKYSISYSHKDIIFFQNNSLYHLAKQNGSKIRIPSLQYLYFVTIVFYYKKKKMLFLFFFIGKVK